MGVVRFSVAAAQVTSEVISISVSSLSVVGGIRCLYSPRVQSHASTTVRALTLPNHCSDTTKLLHTLMGIHSAGFADAVHVPYPGNKATGISSKGRRSSNKTNTTTTTTKKEEKKKKKRSSPVN